MENTLTATKGNRYTDNVKATGMMITRTILDRNIRGMDPRVKMILQESLEVGELEALSYYEFNRVGHAVCCTLRVEFDSWGGDKFKDADGSEWRELTPKVEVSWPGHGESTPALAAARIELYQEVLALANEILASMPSVVMSCWRTAEQIAEDLAEVEAVKLRTLVATVVDANTKGMRLGATCEPFMCQLPSGTWAVGRGSKTFRVDANGTTASITRMA